MKSSQMAALDLDDTKRLICDACIMQLENCLQFREQVEVSLKTLEETVRIKSKILFMVTNIMDWILMVLKVPGVVNCCSLWLYCISCLHSKLNSVKISHYIIGQIYNTLYKK